MKKIIYFLILIITISSCTLTQEPDFINLDDFKIISLNKNEIKLSARAHFKNPNDVGCEVVSTDINVFANELLVSTFNQTKSIGLESDNKFYIPLAVSIPTKKIIKDKSGIFNGLLTTLFNKNFSIKYEGIVTLKKAGIEFDIDIEGEEVLKEFKNKMLNF